MSRPGDANYDRYIYILQSLARLRFFLILADTGDENAMDLLQELVRCLLDCAQCVRAAGPWLRWGADRGRRRPFHPPTIRSVMLGIVNAILEELGPKGVPQAMLDVLLAALVAEVRGAVDARGVGRGSSHARRTQSTTEESHTLAQQALRANAGQLQRRISEVMVACACAEELPVPPPPPARGSNRPPTHPLHSHPAAHGDSM